MRTICCVVAALSAALSIAPTAAQTHTNIARQQLRDSTARREIAKRRVRVAQAQDRLDEALRKAGLPVQADAAMVPARTETPAPSPAPSPAPTRELVAPDAATTLEQARTYADFEDAMAERKAAQEFGGVELGAGFSLTFDLGKNKRVASAQIVNDIVRVTDQNNALARLLLETHYFFKPQADGPFGLPPDMWGLGPFVAIQPGEERIIEAIGLGVMIGFRREETKTNSFNIGVGAIIDPNTRILGDGFVANAAPPAGEVEVRYRETSQLGWMILTSFSF